MHNRKTGVLNWHPLTEERAHFWVAFHGQTSVSVDGSYNVSSVTYNGAGDYTVNFSQAFAGATRYALVGLSKTGNVGGLLTSVGVKTGVICNANSVEITTQSNLGAIDSSFVTVGGWGHT